MSEIGLGALLGLGLWVLIDGRQQRNIASRLAPHLRDVSDRARVVAASRRVSEIVGIVWPHPLRFVVALWRSRRTATTARVEAELAAILDRFAVCLGAGLSLPDTFARVGHDSIGVLGMEARSIARDVSVGMSLAEAFADSDKRVDHESWSRLLDHLLGARRHGTPIVEIVRALAADERAAAGRRLIESASSREIFMLIPLVFVILPMTVLVAVFPGLVAIGSLSV